MRNLIVLFGLLLLVHCSKNQTSNLVVESEYIPLKYDTVPVDSFSDGAMSIDVAEQIRKSSKYYQDSIQKVRVKLEKERLARKEKEKQLAALAQVKKEEAKKKLEAEKPKKEQEKAKQKKDTLR